MWSCKHKQHYGIVEKMLADVSSTDIVNMVAIPSVMRFSFCIQANVGCMTYMYVLPRLRGFVPAIACSEPVIGS